MRGIERLGLRLSDYMGRRKSILLTLGVGWLIIGIAVITNPVPRPDYIHLHEMLPIPVRVLIWMIPGIWAIATAARGRRAMDALAFGLLIIGPLQRALSFFVSWVQLWVPPPFDGDPRGWANAALYLCYAIVIRIVAGWEDTPPGGRDKERGAE